MHSTDIAVAARPRAGSLRVDPPRASAESDSNEKADGAALAAASWGSWRERAPTKSKAVAQHILVASEAQASFLLQQLTSGAQSTFAALASEYSLCPSKERGGELGVFVPGDMAEDFDAFVFSESTPVGVPLGPLKTIFGWHVVLITERTL